MNRLKKSLSSFWYLYVFLPLLGVVFLCYSTYLVNKPRGIETISIFIGSLSTSSASLRETLEENQPSYLREIAIRSYDYNDSNFSSCYSNFGRSDADIIILPESKLNEETIMYYYAKLDESKINASKFYYPGTSSSPYGFLIHSNEKINNSLIEYSNGKYNEDYYAFFNKNSLHLGKEVDTCMRFVSLTKEKSL